MKVKKLTQQIFEEELNIELKERRRKKRERKLADKKKYLLKTQSSSVYGDAVTKDLGYNPYQE